MQLRKNWKKCRDGLAVLRARSPWCNSERIEREPFLLHPAPSKQKMQLRKNWKRKSPARRARAFRRMQLRKNWKSAYLTLNSLSSIFLMQLGKNWKDDLQPPKSRKFYRCNSERIESFPVFQWRVVICNCDETQKELKDRLYTLFS